MLAMIYKLGRCAEQNWRRLRGFQHLTKVIAGRRFRDGVEVEIVEETEQRVAA
jgi:putative transposase